MHVIMSTCSYMYICTLYMYAAYFNDIVVGGVCCRIETEGDQRRLYIMTLGVLAPYRRFGIGKLVNLVLLYTTCTPVYYTVKCFSTLYHMTQLVCHC